MSLQIPAEMAQRALSPSYIRPETRPERPISQATDNVYTEFEDDESDIEHDSLRSSNQSQLDDRRRSDTTISSYNEVNTPRTEHDQFEILIKPVEGPQGPHLFRSSQASADFMFDFALQMSPVELKSPPPRPDTAASYQTARPHRHSRRSLPPVLANIPGLPSNIHDWASQDVIDWMFNSAIEMPIIDSFRDNDITGTVLIDMKFEDLKDLGIQSFGKRHSLWTMICELKGGAAGPSPVPTPFQDLQAHSPDEVDDFEFPKSACSSTSMEDLTPVCDTAPKKRKSRKHRRQTEPQHVDQIDLGRMSLLAIEEKLPPEHTCEKGQDCSKWQRWNRRVQRAKDFNLNFRISPQEGQGVSYTTSRSSSTTQAPCGQPRQRGLQAGPRPISEGVPSIVASSDVFGPGQLPEFALHEDMLQKLEHRDPQENVKRFLQLQHMSSPMEAPQPPTFSPVEPLTPAQPVAAFEEPMFETFPPMYHLPPSGPMQLPSHNPTPLENLKHLPKLSIPRAATASPSLVRRQASVRSPVSAMTPCHTASMSPSGPFRASTPASEMDVPLTAPPMGPVHRDLSQSVPPNMLYREQSGLSRSNSRADWRRPSFAMPALTESDEYPTSAVLPRRRGTLRRASDDSSEVSSALQKTQEMYGADCTHAGWMKKRKTRLLRHEWQEAHFRLAGTQLAMHSTGRQTSKATDTIDVDDYTVNCSTGASNSKLSAALKTLRIKNEERPARDPTSFAFQLVPESERKKGLGQGKTHHFAVQNREDRIDWMRELMLAKAKGQRGKGFDVQINGV